METGIKFDEVSDIQAITRVGGFSRYQFRSCLVLGLSLLQFSIFIAGLPHFISLPSINCDISGKLSQCDEIYVCSTKSKYIFEYHNFQSIVHEWRLVCDDHMIIYIATAVFLVSILIGTLVISMLIERLGRINILRWCSALTTVMEFIMLAAGDPWFFITTLFFVSLTIPGTFLCPFIYIIELTYASSRRFSIVFLLSLCSISYLPAYFLIYYYYSWRPLVLASLFCGFFCFLFSFTLVESPRYFAVILARFSKARTAFEYIASVNKSPMFEDHLQGEILNQYSETIRKRQSADLSVSDLRDLSMIKDISEIRDESNRDPIAPFEYLGGAANAVDRESDLERGLRMNYIDLFREEYRKLILIMTAIWFIQGSAVYSYFHSGFIHEDVYLNVIILAILFILGIFSNGLLGLLLKTKRLLIIFCILSSLAIIIQASLFIVNHKNNASFAIGSILISGLQLSLMTYSLEVLITPIRSIGFGLMYFSSFLGFILGYIALTQPQIMLSMGILMFLCPILLIKTPETGSQLLQDFANWSPL